RGVGDRLHPQGLPDPGRPRIEGTVVALPLRLLPPWLGRPVVVAGAHHDRHPLSRPDDAVEVTREGREAPAVPPYLDAVRPHSGVVIDRLQMEEHAAPAPGCGDDHCPAV